MEYLSFIKSLKKQVIELIQYRLVELFELNGESFKLTYAVVWDCNSNLLLDNPFNGQVEKAIFEVFLDKKKTVKKKQDKDFFYIDDRAVLLRGFTTHSITTFSDDKESQEYIHENYLMKTEFTERLIVLADGLKSTFDRQNNFYEGNSDMLRDELRKVKISMLRTVFNEVKRYGRIDFRNEVITDCNSNIDCLPTDDDEYHNHHISLYYDQEHKRVISVIAMHGNEPEEFIFLTLKDLNILKKKGESANGEAYEFTEELAKITDEVMKSLPVGDTVALV